MDLDLPFVLIHENIASIHSDGVHILDRRSFPFKREFVIARDYKECAKAIRDMVTQGGGPLEVALNAMVLTYRRDRSELEVAAKELSDARKTNTTMRRTIATLMDRYSKGENFEEVVDDILMSFDLAYDEMSDIGASLIEDGMGILTTCFPEHTFMLSVKKAKTSGKRVKVFVPETRPYFQGAHLTEPSLREMGIETYLITDGMPAHFMSKGDINIYMTAADLALQDRTVVNKTGTLSNAIAAKYYAIPYYAFSMGVDVSKTCDDIELEYRDGIEIKEYKHLEFAEEKANAIYPCFDIIPSELVRGIITKEGIL